MDYKNEYWQKNPTYHKSDATRKLIEISSVINSKPRTIIDIGCGGGYLSSLIFDKYSPEKMLGLDISKLAIAEARKQSNSPKLKFVVGDIRVEKLKERYDLGIIADLMEHIEDDFGLISKSLIVCKSLILRVPCEKNTYNDLLCRLNISNEYESLEKRYGHIHHYSLVSLQNGFVRSGFIIEDMRIYPLGKRTKLLNNLAVFVSLIVRLFSEKLALKLFGGFVVFRLRIK